MQLFEKNDKGSTQTDLTIKAMGMIEICNNIRRIREIKNYTQEAVADMVGLSVTAYGDIERGDGDLNFKKPDKIAEVLERKPEEL